MKTSEQWVASEFENLLILDPDGWDRLNYHYSFYEELITEEEFNKRLSKSTTLYMDRVKEAEPLTAEEKLVKLEAYVRRYLYRNDFGYKDGRNVYVEQMLEILGKDL